MKKFENFCKSLKNLKEINRFNEPYDVVTQTGIVTLFENCFEKAWKAIKETLENNGRVAIRIGSPKSIIKLAYDAGMINEPEKWLELLDTSKYAFPYL